MSKVVNLQEVRDSKKAQEADFAYEEWLSSLDKLDLLQEMMRFQEERSKKGLLTLKMMVQGQTLFKVLEEKAETQDLKHLCRSYRRHLKCEIQLLMKK